MPRRLGAFLAELKRRHVYQVAAVYVAVGLGVLGAAELILDPLGLEDLRPAIVVLTLLGLPLAVVLAWAYERTPEGIVRDAPEAATEEPEAEMVAAAAVSEAEERKSIVVLPFDNMSPDPNDAYFSDGLTEEIITQLSYLRSLRVISRNSAMALKESKKDVRTIGRELNVQYVMEGSVRKAGNDLRITAQLIDATTDEHVWAQRYDGSLEDVFRIQEETSQAIVEALKVHFTPEEKRRLAERPMEDLRAYECYLRARHELLAMGEGFSDRSLSLIDRGLEIAGDSDALHALKGHVLFQMVNLMSVPPATFEEVLAEARRCAERALALNPYSAMAHAVSGAVSVNTGDPSGAVRHYGEALQLEPDNPEVLLFLGWTVAAGGWDPEGSRRLLERAGTVDPLTPVMAGATGWLDWMQGHFDIALESFEAWSLQLEAAKSQWRIVIAYLHAARGDTDTAGQVIDRMVTDAPDHMLTALAQFLRFSWLGEKKDALAVLSPDVETAARWDDVWPLMMAEGFAMIDECDRAFEWLEHAIEFGLANAAYIGSHDPFLVPLHSDNRFGQLLGRAEVLGKSLSGLVDLEALLPPP